MQKVLFYRSLSIDNTASNVKFRVGKLLMFVYKSISTV